MKHSAIINLRDYIATRALAFCLNRNANNFMQKVKGFKEAAEEAYELADEMLKARGKNEKNSIKKNL